MHPLLQFCVDHPYVAFFMAWPVALTLISICWSITQGITSMAQSVVNLALGLAYQVTLIMRGHPPHSPSPDDLKPDDGPLSS